MDRDYIVKLIDRIREYSKAHDAKFAQQPAHASCQTRFTDTIAKLEQELAKLEERRASA
ncbi:MAG: hypothetical protein K2X93_09760 [Candidatus Obscuribacterales bacterium]|nr:hypothetical protein [Candidatus Obscuribacterales bacterium]